MKYASKFVVFFAIILLSSGTLAAEPRQENLKNVNLPEWEVRSADVGGTLLFSDSPETVEKDGILYADTVQGKVRLLYYHLNATKVPKKIVAVLENPTNQDMNVTISNHAMGGPSADYLYVGKTAQQEYFKGNNIAFAHVPAYGRRLLHPKFDQTIVEPEKLVYGIFDFEAKYPLKVSVMMLPVNEDPLRFIDRAQVLPADKSHLRGTFTGMDRILKGVKPYDGIKDGSVAITLADGILDRYRTGVDATDGSIVENYGNYGILYKIQIPTKGAGNTKYYLNPQGGVYAGALTVRQGTYGRGEMIPTPLNKAYFGDGKRTTDLTFLGEYNNFSSIWFDFSPPGASNLPTRLILMPSAG